MEHLERIFSEAVRRGMYEEAAGVIFSRMMKKIIQTIAELTENLNRLEAIVERILHAMYSGATSLKKFWSI